MGWWSGGGRGQSAGHMHNIQAYRQKWSVYWTQELQGLSMMSFRRGEGSLWCGCGVVKRYVYVVSSLYDTLIHAF